MASAGLLAAVLSLRARREVRADPALAARDEAELAARERARKAELLATEEADSGDDHDLQFDDESAEEEVRDSLAATTAARSLLYTSRDGCRVLQNVQDFGGMTRRAELPVEVDREEVAIGSLPLVRDDARGSFRVRPLDRARLPDDDGGWVQVAWTRTRGAVYTFERLGVRIVVDLDQDGEQAALARLFGACFML